MFTIEWVLTAVSDCGIMSVVVDVSEFPDCSTIFHLDYHRMGIGSTGILCYIGSTEVNRWVPPGQL